MFSLCCCGGSNFNVRFGFARHRRYGFIPFYSLPRSFHEFFDRFPRDLPGDITSLYSHYDVYGQKEITVVYQYSGDAAMNFTTYRLETINRRGGAHQLVDKSGEATGLARTLNASTTNYFVTYTADKDASGITVIIKEEWDWDDTFLDNPVHGRGHNILTHTWRLTGLVSIDLLRADVEELLNSIDLNALARNVEQVGRGGDGAIGAYFDQNGQIQHTDPEDAGDLPAYAESIMPLTKMATVVTGQTIGPPARDNTGVTYQIFNPATGANYRANASAVALWAGWSLNPPNSEPELRWFPPIDVTAQTSIDEYIPSSNRISYSDRFEVIAAKALVENSPGDLVGRETPSEYGQRMGEDECFDLAVLASGAPTFLLGATEVDVARHPGVVSIKPWGEFGDGRFMQVNQVAC